LGLIFFPGYLVVRIRVFSLGFHTVLTGWGKSFAWWTYDCFGVCEGKFVYSYFNISLTRTHLYLLTRGWSWRWVWAGAFATIRDFKYWYPKEVDYHDGV